MKKDIIHWIGQNEYICITDDAILQYWRLDEVGVYAFNFH